MSNIEQFSETEIADWISSLGFIRGNPFEFNEAEQERSLLPEFFVEFENFDFIKEKKTIVVFAPRGGGKSALRIFLANQSNPITPESLMLAIEYTDYSKLIQKYKNNVSISIEDHVTQILRNGAQSIFESFCGKDKNDLSESRMEKANELPANIRSLTAKFIAQYNPIILTPELIYERFKNIDQDFYYPWFDFAEKFGSKKNREIIKEFPLLNKNPIANLLADLCDFMPTENVLKSYSSAIEQINSLVFLSRQLGFLNVQILVDRIDENDVTANNPQAQADILEPLLSYLPLLEKEGATFKFFLSKEAKDVLLERKTIRRDRLADNFISVSWNNEALKSILDHRLRAFSKSEIMVNDRKTVQVKVHDISMIFEGNFTNEAKLVEEEMIQLAQGSPRRLLVAGKLLLNFHLLHEGAEGLLTPLDWERAKPEVMIQMPPPLQLFRGRNIARVRGEKVSLSKQEFKILLVLAEAGGFCERRNLAYEVWNTAEGVTDQAVDQAIQRIRKKLKDDSSNPVYVKTEKGIGFSLMNFELI